MLRIALVAAVTKSIVRMILRFRRSGRTTGNPYRSQTGFCQSSLRRGVRHIPGVWSATRKLFAVALRMDETSPCELTLSPADEIGKSLQRLLHVRWQVR